MCILVWRNCQFLPLTIEPISKLFSLLEFLNSQVGKKLAASQDSDRPKGGQRQCVLNGWRLYWCLPYKLGFTANIHSTFIHFFYCTVLQSFCKACSFMINILSLVTVINLDPCLKVCCAGSWIRQNLVWKVPDFDV